MHVILLFDVYGIFGHRRAIFHHTFCEQFAKINRKHPSVFVCVCRVIAPVIALLQLSNIEFLGLPHLNLHKIGAWSIDCVCPHSMRLHVTLFIECTRCVAITRFDYAIDLP